MTSKNRITRSLNTHAKHYRKLRLAVHQGLCVVFFGDRPPLTGVMLSRCHYCNEWLPVWNVQHPLVADRKHVMRGLTFDHVVPIAHGGNHSVDNLVLACDACNHQRARDMKLDAIDITRKLQQHAMLAAYVLLVFDVKLPDLNMRPRRVDPFEHDPFNRPRVHVTCPAPRQETV